MFLVVQGHLRYVTLNGSTIETWANSSRVPLVDGRPILVATGDGGSGGFEGPTYGGPYLRGGGSSGKVPTTYFLTSCDC